MFKKSDTPFSYTIIDDFDKIIDEKGNNTINLRKLYWGEDSDKERLDLRKWIQGAQNEICTKNGFSFLTEEGPHNLTEVLVEEGYGRTKEVLEGLKNREDFRPALNVVLGKGDEYYDESVSIPEENYFDPRQVLLLED